MIYSAVIAAFLFFLAFVIKRDRSGSVPALLFKVITSLCFMVTAFIAVNVSGNTGPETILIVTGLLMGLVGDIYLDLMFVYDRDREVHLLTGMAAFSLGHICYIIAVTMLLHQVTALVYGLLASAAFSLLTVIVGTKSGMMDFGKLKVPSFIYGVLVAGFFTTTLIASLMSGFTSCLPVMMTVASFLFFASDSVLSMTYFGGKDSKLMIISNHLFYYTAQFLIALSILYIW